MGADAELGPLDAQVFDFERERPFSALDEIQALERLNVQALEQIDQAMWMLTRRMPHKRLESILPHVLAYVNGLMNPLIEKIDTVHYTEQSRVLKVAEDYATRLLQPKYSQSRADSISSDLVNKYNEHGFVITREEASAFLDMPSVSEEQDEVLDELGAWLTFNEEFALGTIKEVSGD
jgi:hypothetical protein